MTGCRVLALAPNPWDGQWMNRQQILSRLSHKHRILYTNGPWRVWDRSRPDFRACPWLGGFAERDGVLVDRPPRVLLAWPNRGNYDQLVTWAVQRRWRSQLARMGAGARLIYVFHPSLWRHATGLPHEHLVYQPYDLFSRMPGWSSTLAREEAKLLERADIVIASSEGTRDELARRTSRPVICIPNGVDIQLFADPSPSLTPPVDISSIPQPRIGYVGTLNRKVDLALIANLARRRRDWQFVLIGPEGSYDDATSAARGDCGTQPNIHFMGNQPKEKLPLYMRALDVGLMCYRPGTWMDVAYPLKLNEYLASGIPIVSSDLRSVRNLDHVLAIARGVEDWEAAITRALCGEGPGSQARRREVASQNSWDDIVARIDTLIAELPGRLDPPAPSP